MSCRSSGVLRLPVLLISFLVAGLVAVFSSWVFGLSALVSCGHKLDTE